MMSGSNIQESSLAPTYDKQKKKKQETSLLVSESPTFNSLFMLFNDHQTHENEIAYSWI